MHLVYGINGNILLFCSVAVAADNDDTPRGRERDKNMPLHLLFPQLATTYKLVELKGKQQILGFLFISLSLTCCVFRAGNTWTRTPMPRPAQSATQKQAPTRIKCVSSFSFACTIPYSYNSTFESSGNQVVNLGLQHRFIYQLTTHSLLQFAPRKRT